MKNVVYRVSAMMLASVCTVTLAHSPGANGSSMGYHSSVPGAFSIQRGVRFERDRDQRGYRLRIYLRGIAPEAIHVSVRGRALVVENRESHQVKQRNDQNSYRFSSTSSSMRRRFPLPPDADIRALQRTGEKGLIVITLPYATQRYY